MPEQFGKESNRLQERGQEAVGRQCRTPGRRIRGRSGPFGVQSAPVALLRSGCQCRRWSNSR